MSQYIFKPTEQQKKFAQRIDEIISAKCKSKDMISSLKSCVFELYVELFGTVPHKIELDYDGLFLNKEHELSDTKSNRFDCIRETRHGGIFIGEYDDDDITDNKKDKFYTFGNKAILEDISAINIIENYKGNEIAVYRIEEEPFIVIGDDIKVIYYKMDNYLTALCPDMELPAYIKDNIEVDDEDDDEIRYFEYVVYDNKGFNTTDLPVKHQEIDIDANYNDDLPDEDIKDFINDADSGLCILHGAPGTGKTTYIRHLMHECKDAQFMILNASCFDAINDASFVNLIVNEQGSIIILEDCEDMLSERMSGNSRIATLLNLSDGILGDALRLKFICTFNAKLGKIDPAILRKGRTHIKYEFKELTKEKAQNLAETLNIKLPEKKGNAGYTLAEIYNADNTNVDTNIGNKVGFNK